VEFRNPRELTVGREILEPSQWPDDGGTRRVEVLDPNFDPPRVVRRVGWRPRMRCCRFFFFSQDVQRLRLCTQCKGQADQLDPWG
jgi:hypothetical protein